MPARFTVTASDAACRSSDVEIGSAAPLGGGSRPRTSRARLEAVGQDRPADFMHDAAQLLVVRAQHRQAVERQVVQKVDKLCLRSPKSPPCALR